MTRSGKKQSEAERLEALWAGSFGDDYVTRNRQAGDPRQEFWRDILKRCAPSRVLEVGCNLGANLRWIAAALPPTQVYGIDVNSTALQEVNRSLPGVNTLCCAGRELPFRDRWFDLTFTMGVLIHQPEATLPLVMNEIVRCSRRFVLCGEYHSERTTEVPYREQEGALFKRDYGRLYRELFPELTERAHGLLGKDQGWDDVTWWLFEKS